MLKEISNFYILKTITDQFYPRNRLTIMLMSRFYFLFGNYLLLFMLNSS